MKRRGTVMLAFLAILVMMSTLLVIAEDTPAKPTAPAAPEVLGSKDTAKWTETTTKAAGTPEQKAVLAGGKVVTITGELVEVSCYLQLGKKGEAHIPCGSAGDGDRHAHREERLRGPLRFGWTDHGGEVAALTRTDDGPRATAYPRSHHARKTRKATRAPWPGACASRRARTPSR
jgi:hypothetical protein